MNFLGIGAPELILVLVVAVIVVGPQRLPEVAVQLARVIRRVRGYATDVTAQMRGELDELMKEYEQVRHELREFRESVRGDVSSVTQEVERTLRETQPIIEPSGEPAAKVPKPDQPPPEQP